MERLRVLVTDGDTRPGLAVTRAVGRLGHFVIVSAHRERSLASVSRFSGTSATYPDPARDPDAFVARVADLAREHNVDVLIPVTEITTRLLTQHQHALPATCRLPFPSASAVARASDKKDILALAKDLGVPTPRTIVVTSPKHIPDCTQNLGYPIVVKPACSRVLSNASFISTSVSYAPERESVKRILASLPPAVFPVLLQERLEGEGVGVFACFQDGSPVALFAHRRIREKPPSGGVSVLCESTAVDPEAAEHASKLLRALNWRGVAMVEFKRDNRDGTLKLMEINGRFWGSLQLAIDAGVNFPALAVAIAQGRKLEPVAGYDIGVRSRWLWGDLDSLLILLRKPRTAQLPESHPGFWRTLLSFLNFFDRRTRYDSLQRDDLRPWLLESKRWFTRG